MKIIHFTKKENRSYQLLMSQWNGSHQGNPSLTLEELPSLMWSGMAKKSKEKPKVILIQAFKNTISSPFPMLLPTLFSSSTMSFSLIYISQRLILSFYAHIQCHLSKKSFFIPLPHLISSAFYSLQLLICTIL